MKKNELKKMAQKIISSNIYLTLATCGKRPWASPVYYCVDKNYNFYYISQLNSLHTKNIFSNRKVSFAIFDSHQKEGGGNGVQVEGIAKRIFQDKEIKKALRWYQTRFIDNKPESFKGKKPYRLFKIIPKHFYILNPEVKVDKRVEVKI